MSTMPRKTQIYLISISALLTALAFPPYKIGFLIFLSPLLLLLVLERARPAQAFLNGYIWGLIFNLAVLYGVFWATIPGTFGMLAIISLLPAINCLVYSFVSKRSSVLGYVVWALSWVSWDFLRTLTELNFPWADYGYTLSYYLPMIQAAEIFGVYGISLMIHLANVLLYTSLKSRFKPVARLISLVAALLLPVLFLVYGWIRLPAAADEGDLKIALIQGNITRDIKWQEGGEEYSFDIYMDMTRSVDSSNADLIIWPETATPFYLLHEPMRLRQVKNIVDSLNIPILTGTPLYDRVGFREYIFFNGAVLITPGTDSIPVYEKIKLVPMSERIPFSGRFKKLREIRLGQADFSSGRWMTVFSVDSTAFATLICFESVFPDLCADFCRKGAQFLVVITNDMWFGPSSLPYQHARMSVFRAIENRVPLVRCANTGVSMFVDRWGRTYDETGMFERRMAVGSIKPEKSNSIYNRYGDILPVLCIAGTLLSIIAVAFSRRKGYNGGYEN
jgi:apolipoprotein N-acyltransferase